MFECHLSQRKSLYKTFSHLRPLRSLTCKDKSESRAVDVSFTKHECRFVKTGALCDHIGTMEVTTSAIGQGIGQIRHLDTYTRIYQMLTDCLAVCSQRPLVVCGENEDKWSCSDTVSKEVIVIGDEGSDVSLDGPS